MKVKGKLSVWTEEAFLDKVELVEVLRQELNACVVPLRRADGLTEVAEVADLLGVHLGRLTVVFHNHVLQDIGKRSVSVFKLTQIVAMIHCSGFHDIASPTEQKNRFFCC